MMSFRFGEISYIRIWRRKQEEVQSYNDGDDVDWSTFTMPHHYLMSGLFKTFYWFQSLHRRYSVTKDYYFLNYLVVHVAVDCSTRTSTARPNFMYSDGYKFVFVNVNYNVTDALCDRYFTHAQAILFISHRLRRFPG